MKGFAKIALTVALVAVIVLSIVVASVAWFTSNPEVNANDVTLNAARTLTVTFDPTVTGTDYKYNGEIGNVASGNDAPYVYEAGSFTVNINSLSSDSHYGKIKVEFGSVTILTKSSGTITNVLISDLFYISADVYTQDHNGAFVKDATSKNFRAYNSETDSALTRYRKKFADLTIADDGILMKTEDAVTSMALFGEGSYVLSFTYVFLPETEYLTKYLAANYNAIVGYELSATGSYIGVVNYTTYKAKYHYGMTRYTKSGNVYTENEDGDYVRVITSYQPYGSVTKYDSSHNIDASGTYIKLGDSNDYVEFDRYNQVSGFPYSNDRYRGEKFRFTVGCSVEEVNNEA